MKKNKNVKVTKIEEIHSDDISNKVLKKGITIIYIYNHVSGQSNMCFPAIQEIAEERLVYMIDFFSNFEFIKSMKLRSISPTTLIYKNGKHINTLVGLKTREMIEGYCNE